MDWLEMTAAALMRQVEEYEMTLTEKLKVARGKGYFTVLKAILAECGQQMADDARDTINQNEGKYTTLDIGKLAVKYDLNFKATCEWLEESQVIPTGTYIRLKERGLKATEVLETARTT